MGNCDGGEGIESGDVSMRPKIDVAFYKSKKK